MANKEVLLAVSIPYRYSIRLLPNGLGVFSSLIPAKFQFLIGILFDSYLVQDGGIATDKRQFQFLIGILFDSYWI